MAMKWRKKAASIGLGTVLVAALAACGSGSSSGGSASGGGTDSAGLAKAQAFLAPYQKNPTSVGVTEPLSSKPPTGKLLIVVTTTEATSLVKDAGIEAGAKALGWNYDQIPIDTTNAKGGAQAMQLALAKKPDMISLGGLPLSSISDQLKQACSEHVTVVEDSQPTLTKAELAPYPCIVASNIIGGAQLSAEMKIVAAQIVTSSKGDADVMMLNVPSYPVLVEEAQGFKDAMKEFCSGCKVTEVDVQGSDIGTPSISTRVVNFLRTNPDTKYVVATFGDIIDGVRQALTVAGMHDITLGGSGPTTAETQDLKSGNPGGWAGRPQTIVGWRIVDQFARNMLGDSLDPTLTLTPTQILTPDTVNDAVFDPKTDFYVGVPDFESQFLKLWHVS